MQDSSSQLPDRIVVESQPYPQRENDPYHSQGNHSHQPMRGRKRKHRFGYLVRYPFASARAQPFMTAFLFIFTLLIGMSWWIAEPSVWQVEAAIVIAPPKTDDFLRLTTESTYPDSQPQNDNSITSINNQISSTQGFRSLSPREVGELLRTPAVVSKAKQQLHLLHNQNRKNTESTTNANSPLELVTARAVQFHDSSRKQLTDYFHSVLSNILSNTDDRKNNPTASLSSNGTDDLLEVNFLTSAPNENHVLRMKITASQPYLAEGAADMLVQLAKNKLSEFESENSLQHLRDLQPKSDQAKIALDNSQQNLDQYLNSLTTPNPSEKVSTLATQLSNLRESKSQLETQTTEAEAERLAVMNQLEEMKRNGEAYISTQKTAENPRILDIKREISELQAKHDALVDFTEEHPEKKSLREQINKKKQELNDLPPTIVIEDVREPNPIYETLDQRRLSLDRTISQLAGRDVGIDKEINITESNLETTRKQAKTLATLESNKKKAELAYNEVHDKVVYLMTKMAQSRQFQHIQLMETPRVYSATMPDQPNILSFLFITLAGALTISLVIPTVRSQIRARVVTKEQVEALAYDVPIVIIGEIPDKPMRKLLTTR